MKRGFTMIELLGIFTLMGVILLLVIPQITSLLKKSNEEEYQTFINSINLATEAYIEDKQIKILDNQAVTVTLKELIESGFLKSSLVNPNNNKQVSNHSNINKVVVVTKNKDNILEYSLQD